MPCFSLCVTTMTMGKLQPSFYATYVEICALTVTDSFIFIGEPRLIKDRWRLLSVRAEQYLRHRIHSVNFEMNGGRRLAVMGRKGLCNQSLSGVPSCLTYRCVNQGSRPTSLRLSFHIYKNRAIVKIQDKIGNVRNFLECLVNKNYYRYWVIKFYTSSFRMKNKIFFPFL